MHKDELVALRPDCVVHTAMTDADPFAALGLFEELLAAGINVVSSGPVFLQHPQGIIPDDMIASLQQAGGARRRLAARQRHRPRLRQRRPAAGADLAVAAHRPGAVLRDRRLLDVLPALRQPELYGFGKPMDDVPPLFAGGILTMAWGSVVRIIAAGLDLTLDEPLEETVEFARGRARLRPPSAATSRPAPAARVRFEVIGKVDGVPRVVLEHVTRTHPEQRPDWPQPASGDGCYRVEVTGEPMMTLDFAHHGEHGRWSSPAQRR